jgi:group I intron endonuclease
MYASSVSGVYAITQLSSGRRYIGSAINTRKRWASHRWHLCNDCHHCRFLQAAWRKYGEADFDFTVLEVVGDPTDLLAREIAWLAITPRSFNSQRPRAEERIWTGMKHSPLTLKRMSAIHKRLNQSPELLAKKTAANRRRAQTTEARAKSKEVLTQRLLDPAFAAKWRANYSASRPHTDEASEKMRAAHKLRPPQSEETRRRRSETLRGRKPSEETRHKLSEANRRWVRTPEMRANMSRGQRARAARRDLPHDAEGRFIRVEPAS